MASTVMSRPWPLVLKALSRFSTTFLHGHRGKKHSVHRVLNNSGYDKFSSVLARCGKVEDLRALKSLLIGDLRSEIAMKRQQNLLLKHLCDHGLFEDTLLIYRKCRYLGFLSDNYTFPFVIKACAGTGDFLTGTATHCLVLKFGFCQNLVVQTALVGFYSVLGEIDTARFLFDGMPEPDVVAWNAVISGSSFNGFDVEVLQFFRQMCARGLKPNVSTLASVIPVCSRVGAFDAGRSIHGFALKSGIDMEESLLPALISMYAGYGDILISKSLFDCSKPQNTVIWNSMISACTKNQKPDWSFELFKKLLHYGMQPNIVTFVSIIPSFENLGRFFHCQSIHAYVIKFGLENQHSVATALLSVYAKQGNINSAEFLFNSMLWRNLLSWNSMVSAYVGNGFPGACLDTFRQMQFAGFNPDAISIISVLSACSELEAFLLGKSAHAFSLKNGFDLQLNVSNALLGFYSNCNHLSLSFYIFQRMMTKNVVSWNTMISGSIYNGQAENALLLFQQMQQDDVGFDLVTLVSLLPACCEVNDLMLGVAIHGYVIKTGLVFEVSLVNALLSMYSNCGDIESSVLLFKDLPTRNVISWNALITGYRNHDLQDGAFGLVHQMIEENHKPNYITLLNVLPLCNTYFQGKAIHGYSVRTGILCEAPFLSSSLILMYARFGNPKSCKLLFQQGEVCSLSLWNAVISGHVILRDAVTAFSFFIELLQRGICPDSVTILTVLSACSELNNLVLADSLFAYLIHEGFDKDIAINNALIDLYIRCGNLSFSRKLFDLFPEKDPISWSMMIHGYGSHGDGEAALNLFYQMRYLGMNPDEITYLNVLSACSHAGLVEECKKVLNCMVHDDGLVPRIEHYACLLDLLGRTGYLIEAYDIVKSLLNNNDYNYSYKSCYGNILESLLGACLIHGNTEVGEEIGKVVMEMEPGKSSGYVILHNVYAAAGRWMDANRVRSEMEKNKVRKVPGFSLIDGCRDLPVTL